jgi:hypothetical protein
MEKKNYVILTNSNDWVGGGELTEEELKQCIEDIKEWYLESGSNEVVEFFAYEVMSEPVKFV